MNHRRRNRNAVRDVAILPPAVDAKAEALGTLDAETQARAVSVMLTHAALELAKANDAQSVLEWKAKAGAIHELTKQLQLGKELRLNAVEFVRLTERALGIAIRQGQERGEINGIGNHDNRGNQAGRSSLPTSSKKSPSDFATPSELQGANRSGEGIYAMTDCVSDAQFAQALAEARAEGNLSRANVARKARALASAADPQSTQPEPSASAESKRRLTKHDSTEMLANINGMLNGIVESIPFIDQNDIDATANRAVIKNIRKSMAQISALLKGIENG